MKQSLPSLTVVIPNFNHGHLIGKQLNSILSQSAQATRIIVIDDASTDDSKAIIQRLISPHASVEFICKERNSGCVAVINEALRLATTDYICFLAADDITLPSFFEKALTLLARYPEAGLCSGVSIVQYCSKVWTWPDWVAYPCSAPGFVSPERVRDIFMRNESWFMTNTAIFRREPLLAAGGQIQALHDFADGFACRILALRHGACFIPEPLAIFRRSDSSLSGSANRDAVAMTQLLIAVNTYMTTDFHDLFPDRLIARNNARMLYRILCVKLNNFVAYAHAAVESARPIEGGALLLFIVRSGAWVAKFLFLCVLRFRDIPSIALSKYFTRPGCSNVASTGN